jgi:hypothetical protein
MIANIYVFIYPHWKVQKRGRVNEQHSRNYRRVAHQAHETNTVSLLCSLVLLVLLLLLFLQILVFLPIQNLLVDVTAAVHKQGSEGDNNNAK